MADDRSRAVRVAVAVVRAYQVTLGAHLLGGSCRFVPSCSAYAIEALEHHGVLRGGILAARRLARCRPLGGWGIDPVPPPRAETGPGDAE